MLKKQVGVMLADKRRLGVQMDRSVGRQHSTERWAIV
jgi:hypothetical protein